MRVLYSTLPYPLLLYTKLRFFFVVAAPSCCCCRHDGCVWWLLAFIHFGNECRGALLYRLPSRSDPMSNREINRKRHRRLPTRTDLHDSSRVSKYTQGNDTPPTTTINDARSHSTPTNHYSLSILNYFFFSFWLLQTKCHLCVLWLLFFFCRT